MTNLQINEAMKISSIFLTIFITAPLIAGKSLPEKESILKPVTVDRLISNGLISSYTNDKGQKVLDLSGRSLADLTGIEKLDLDNYHILDLSKNSLENLDLLSVITSNDLLKIKILENKKIVTISDQTLFDLQENIPTLDELNIEKSTLSDEVWSYIEDESLELNYYILYTPQ